MKYLLLLIPLTFFLTSCLDTIFKPDEERARQYILSKYKSSSKDLKLNFKKTGGEWGQDGLYYVTGKFIATTLKTLECFQNSIHSAHMTVVCQNAAKTSDGMTTKGTRNIFLSGRDYIFKGVTLSQNFAIGFDQRNGRWVAVTTQILGDASPHTPSGKIHPKPPCWTTIQKDASQYLKAKKLFTDQTISLELKQSRKGAALVEEKGNTLYIIRIEAIMRIGSMNVKCDDLSYSNSVRFHCHRRAFSRPAILGANSSFFGPMDIIYWINEDGEFKFLSVDRKPKRKLKNSDLVVSANTVRPPPDKEIKKPPPNNNSSLKGRSITIFIDGVAPLKSISVTLPEEIYDIAIGSSATRKINYLYESALADLISEEIEGTQKKILWSRAVSDTHNIDKAVNDTVKEILAANKKGENIHLITHSMGTIIGYLALVRYNKMTKEKSSSTFQGISNFVTLASPLSNKIIIEAIHEQNKTLGLPEATKKFRTKEKLGIKKHWINIYADNDPIGKKINGSDVLNKNLKFDGNPVKAHSVPYQRESSLKFIVELLKDKNIEKVSSPKNIDKSSVATDKKKPQELAHKILTDNKYIKYAYHKVIAEPTLSIRKSPTVKSKKTGSIRKNQFVRIIKNTGKKETISGKYGEWVKIEVYNKKNIKATGYVFGDFLVDKEDDIKPIYSQTNSLIIDVQKNLEKKKYNNIYGILCSSDKKSVSKEQFLSLMKKNRNSTEMKLRIGAIAMSIKNNSGANSISVNLFKDSVTYYVLDGKYKYTPLISVKEKDGWKLNL